MGTPSTAFSDGSDDPSMPGSAPEVTVTPKKRIRVQIEMFYDVDADKADIIVANDTTFFEHFRDDFYEWENRPEIGKTPIIMTYAMTVADVVPGDPITLQDGSILTEEGTQLESEEETSLSLE